MSNFLGSADTMGNILTEKIKYGCHRTIRETNGTAHASSFLLLHRHLFSGWHAALYRSQNPAMRGEIFAMTGTCLCKVTHSLIGFTHFYWA